MYRSVVPQDMASRDRLDGLDDAYVMAEMMAVADGVITNWTRMGMVSYADGAYLELQARQSSLFKQSGENDDALRARIQTPPFAITPDLILESIQRIVDSAGGGQVFMLELPRDAIYLNRDSFLSRDQHIGITMVILRIPASANAASACTDALRSKIAAGKRFIVQEYTT